MTRAGILAKFKKFGISPTEPRLEVAALLLRRPQHLSAEQVLDRLYSRGSSVSTATVYNSLKLFAKRGLIRECIVDPERRFYDSRTTPHHHFYNVDTGKLSDIPAHKIKINGLPKLPRGTHCAGIELVVRVRKGAE